ncbi:hypothetical protein HK102_001920 [Quaeritorhiza haematococci]|nr:hypothetical protein HK102_001920 [Quaeritorhiza haematococci]
MASVWDIYQEDLEEYQAKLKERKERRRERVEKHGHHTFQDGDRVRREADQDGDEDGVGDGGVGGVEMDPSMKAFLELEKKLKLG